MSSYNKKAKTMFNSPISKSEAGILAKLWRKIMIETGLENSLEFMITRYVRKSSSLKAGKFKTKSHITKDISAGSMSFKTFADLLISFVGVLKFDISIKLYYKNGDSSVHTMTVIKESSAKINKEVKNENDTRNN